MTDEPLEIDYPPVEELAEFSRRHQVPLPDVLRDIARLVMLHQLATTKNYLGDDCVVCGGMAMRLYGSHRYTRYDTDLSYRLDDWDEETLQSALTITVEDLTIRAPDMEAWQRKNALTIAQPVEFRESFAQAALTPDIAQFTVTVARRGLLRQATPLPLVHPYRPMGIEGVDIPAMNLTEQTAEKIIAWCANGLAKHYLDVAWLFRKKAAKIDVDDLRILLDKKLGLAYDREPSNYERLRTIDHLFRGLYSGDAYKAPQNPEGKRKASSIRYIGQGIDMGAARTIIRQEAIPRIWPGKSGSTR
ncbi:MAG TPA: nucleotidyl transferase AbiEii/AbiGii toxin family protein [Thermoleophilaceae bacterium]|nr:nucleotidyl transferase AbiEii/AbiGii toxin family protein [Thermoleophilaceae bacterium]